MNERVARAHLVARVHLAHEPDFVLGKIEVRPARREIVGEGTRDTIDPRVMRVLVALARARGEILSRDDLIESCWDGVIVGEDAITRCISRLRSAAEACGNAFSIETVPRVGYRLVTADAAAIEAKGRVEPEQPPVQTTQMPWPTRNRWTAIAALVLLALFAGGTWLWWSRPMPVHVQAWTASSPAGPANSVVVLPFANMSGDPAKEYFSDGFTEELINDLSAAPNLRVVARTSAFAFKGRNGDTQSIARDLHVKNIVEGSVREVGTRVRITAQLIDAGNGYNIWSASYDRNLADILSVQRDVARAVTIALSHKIIPAASRTPTIDPAVYLLYLQGRQQLDTISPDGYRKAYPMLKEVAAREPRFSDGQAGFSRAAFGYSQFDSLHEQVIVAEAKAAATRALLLDPRNIEARALQGLFELDAWNWKNATSIFRSLRAESPNHLRVLAGLRSYYDTMGFPEEAVAVMERARQLDPLSDAPRSMIIIDLYETRRFQEAIEVGRAILAHHSADPWGLISLCYGDASTGQIEAARKADDSLRRLKSDSSDNCEFDIDVSLGDIAAARAILARWAADFPDQSTHATDLAEHYVLLGDFDKASDWFERAYDRRECEVFESAYWGNYATYHQTARWKALILQPKAREWQAEHDRIAAELKARGGQP